MEKTEQQDRKCFRCGEIFGECCCFEDEVDWDDEREDWPLCGCQYCFCHVQTEDGGPCSSCLSHAHQG